MNPIRYPAGAAQAERCGQGFTLLELLTVLAVVGLLALTLLPTLAHSRPQVRALQCLDNLRQMQAGWSVYASDFCDVMVPGGPLGTASSQSWCGGLAEDWNYSPANTDPSSYLSGLLAPYIGNQIGLYKCPGDTIPSLNGPRIRSYSMSGAMGNVYTRSLFQSYNPGYLAYVKVTDLVGSVPPSKGLVFLEENMCSLYDSWLELSLPQTSWPDVPGSYHNGAMGVSFADGHTELHQWVTLSLEIPVQYGIGWPGHTAVPKGPPGPTNPDWVWWKAHTTAPAN